MIPAAQLRPAAWQKPAHPVDGRADAKPRRWIESARPIKSILEGAVAGPRSVVAVADDRGMDLGLLVFARPKKPRPFGRADPFVRIAGVVSRALFAHIHWQHAGRVGAI